MATCKWFDVFTWNTKSSRSLVATYLTCCCLFPPQGFDHEDVFGSVYVVPQCCICCSNSGQAVRRPLGAMEELA